MKAETIAVGTELLIGQIANTNAQYLSQKLNSYGVDVYYHTVVGDNPKRVVDTIKTAFLRSDYIFITGGLGPTEDDLTREAVAEFAGVSLVADEEAQKKIRNYFESRNIQMPLSNLKQGTFPEGAVILKNGCGTAPGFLLTVQNKVIVVLPGPPKEMQHIFENEVVNHLFNKDGFTNHSKYVKVFGIGEDALEDALIDLINKQTSPSIATYVKDGEVTVRLTSKVTNNNFSDDAFQPVLGEILKRLGDKVFSIDNEELHETCGRLLKEKNITFSTAESCTGGMLSQKFTQIPGISAVFNAGFVTYSDDSKVKILNVNPKTLQAYGAVSKETALEMAINAREITGSRLSISITGIAGPEGGTETKPVGLVYIALATENTSFTTELRLRGDRERIRTYTALHALDIIRKHILELN